MALEFIDGWDHYTSNTNLQRKWNASSVGSALATGRFAGNAFDLTGSPGATITLTSVATRTVGFAFWVNGTMTAGTFCAFQDAGTTQVDLRTTAGGAIQVTRAGTVLATSSNNLVASAWYYIEFQATIDPSAGGFTLKVWNSPTPGIWATASGINTRNTSNSSANMVNLAAFRFDDFYALNSSGSRNNDFLGESRIFTTLANADNSTATGTNLLWTPDSGTPHYSRVNESEPNDDTSYVASGTPGQIDTYKYPAIAPTGTIAGVQVTLTARKDDVGTRQISAEYRSAGAVNYAGSNVFSPTTSYGMFRQMYETDPATSATWTASNVNNGEFGVNCVA